MFTYILSIVLAWFLWKLFWIFKKWRDVCESVAHIPSHPANTRFLGLVGKVTNLDDIIRICTQYVEKASPKWFTAWTLFLYPNVNPVTPNTIRAVLTATNVPKNHGQGGAYRMMLPWIGDGLLLSGGKKWERNRRLLTPAFHFDILKPYVDSFNDVVEIFLEKIKEMSKSESSIDIYPMVSRATLDTMLRCTLSYKDETIQNSNQHHPYVVAVHRLAYLLIQRCMKPAYFIDFIYNRSAMGKEFNQLCEYVHEFSQELVAARRRAVEEDPSQLDKRLLDFLDILITARDDNGVGLTDLEIRDEVDTFVFEGHDTTASAVSWAIHSLAKYPEMQEKVRLEVELILDGRKRLTADDLPRLTYTTCFIKETLRMYTPVPATSRKIIEPLTMEGTTFLPGQVFDIHAHILHHNPAFWDNHKEFRPERFFPENMEGRDPFAFLPFSAGQRNCIGQHFAMNEIKVFVSKVATRYKVTLDSTREAIPFPELVMRAKNGMYLQFVER